MMMMIITNLTDSVFPLKCIIDNVIFLTKSAPFNKYYVLTQVYHEYRHFFILVNKKYHCCHELNWDFPKK